MLDVGTCMVKFVVPGWALKLIIFSDSSGEEEDP